MIPHDAHLHIGSLLFEGIDQIEASGACRIFSVCTGALICGGRAC
jgi:cyclohexyl-isocyanide hydratase